MSNLVTNRVQLGQSNTAANNFVLAVPTVPDGTIKLSKGIIGATTADIITIDNTGNVGLYNNLTIPGNVSLTGTGKRITGDFSNATVASRVMFQSSTTNSYTAVGLVPNGTVASGATASAFRLDDSTSISTGNGSTGTFTMFQSDSVRIASSISGTGTYLPLTFFTGGAERLRIDASGNVGIGTIPAGSTKLHILGDSVAELRITSSGDLTTSTPVSLVRFGGSNSQISGYVGYGGAANTYDIANTLNGPMRFYTNNSERMRIDSSGNVGIGTNSPLSFSTYSTLSINGTGGGITSLMVNGTETGRIQVYSGVMNVNAQGASTVLIFNTNSAERLRIGTSGEIGLGGANYGSAGQVLTSNGSGAAASWTTVSAGSALPSQTGNAGKFLTTNGTNTSWGDAVSLTGTQTLTNKTLSNSNNIFTFANRQDFNSTTTIANSISSTTIDLATGSYFYKTITENTTFTFSNAPTTSKFFAFVVELTGAGSYTIGWPASIKWPDSITPGFSLLTDMVSFSTRDGGSTWRGNIISRNSQ